MYERPDFLYQVPAGMVFAQILFVLLLRILLWSLRWLGVASWTARPVARKLLTFAVIALVAVTPIVALIGIVLALLVAAVAFGAYSAVVMTPWGRARFVEPRVRSRLRAMTADGVALSSTDREPLLIRSWRKALGRIRFSHVSTLRHEDGIVRAVLVQPETGVIADLLWQPVRVDTLPLPSVHLISVVAGRRGTLSTTILGMLETCPDLLVQRVAVASPAKLLAYHAKAGQMLEEFGVRFQPLDVDDAMEVVEWVRGSIVDHLLSLPVGSMPPRLRDLARARLLAPRLGDPEVVRRIEAFRGAEPVSTVPGRGDRGSGPAGPSGSPPPVPA
jgi:hypothetical protein